MNNDGLPYTLGYEFNVTSPITVIGLSAFTANPAAGLNENTPVGLWDASQNLLASATVLSGTTDPLTSDGFFRYATLSVPITLPDGTYYVGAEFEANVDLYTYYVNGLATMSGVTFVGAQDIEGSNLSFPSPRSPASDGFFGGNVVVQVPEPGVTMLLLMGLAGLAALDGRKRP